MWTITKTEKLSNYYKMERFIILSFLIPWKIKCKDQKKTLWRSFFSFTTWCQWLNSSSAFHGKCFKSLSHRLKPKITLPLCFIWLYNFNLLSIYQIFIFYYVLTLLHQVYIKLLCQWNKSDWNEIMNIISWKSLYLPQSMIPALLAPELQN